MKVLKSFAKRRKPQKNESIKKLNDCQQRQENDRIEAEAKATRDSEAAAENARQDQIRQQKAAAERQTIKQEKLEADKNHVASIKRDVMADFMSVGLDESSARLATRALAAKKIRHTGINY